MNCCCCVFFPLNGKLVLLMQILFVVFFFFVLVFVLWHFQVSLCFVLFLELLRFSVLNFIIMRILIGLRGKVAKTLTELYLPIKYMARVKSPVKYVYAVSVYRLIISSPTYN